MAALTRKKDEDDDKTAGSGAERLGDVPGSAETEATEGVGPGEQPASTFVVKVQDREIDVDVKDGPGSIDTSDENKARAVEDLSADDLQKLQKALLEENAARGIRDQSRPFADIDKESLLVLQSQLRAELISR